MNEKSNNEATDNNEKIEQVESKEIPEQEKEKIKEKVVFTEDNRKLQFYEILRKRIYKFVKNNTGETGGKLANYLLTLPDFFILLCRLAVDKRVTKTQKAFVGGIIAYIIMPIDIIPDFIPIIGYIDDLVLVVYGLNLIMNELDKQVLLDNWSGDEDVLELLQKISLSAEQFLDKNFLRKIKKWVKGIGK